ncbi:MAG: DUF3857 domain-containing protein, partial [Deltaproteobacteria bacterium]|nr:DUF3857 domain-containing protein [Deltaproteobacteria bacterium]
MRLGLILSVCLLPALASAAPSIPEPFQASAKQLRALRTGKIKADTPAVVLADDVRFDFDDKGRRRARYHRIIEIRTAEGVRSWSSVRATWEPWHSRKPKMRARVLSGGRFKSLDPSTINEPPSKDSSTHTYSDRRTLQAPFPAVKIGSIIEYEIDIRDHRPRFGPASNLSYSFAWTVPSLRNRVVVTSKGRRIRHRLHNLRGLRPRKARRKKTRLVTFEYGRVDPRDYEGGKPYRTTGVPLIEV